MANNATNKIASSLFVIKQSVDIIKPNETQVSNHNLADNFIVVIILLIKSALYFKVYIQKNYFVFFIIFSNACICILNSFSPFFVIA